MTLSDNALQQLHKELQLAELSDNPVQRARHRGAAQALLELHGVDMPLQQRLVQGVVQDAATVVMTERDLRAAVKVTAAAGILSLILGLAGMVVFG